MASLSMLAWVVHTRTGRSTCSMRRLLSKPQCVGKRCESREIILVRYGLLVHLGYTSSKRVGEPGGVPKCHTRAMAARRCAVCGTENPMFSSNRKLDFDYCRGCQKIQPFTTSTAWNPPPPSTGSRPPHPLSQSLDSTHLLQPGAPPPAALASWAARSTASDAGADLAASGAEVGAPALTTSSATSAPEVAVLVTPPSPLPPASSGDISVPSPADASATNVSGGGDAVVGCPPARHSPVLATEMLDRATVPTNAGAAPTPPATARAVPTTATAATALEPARAPVPPLSPAERFEWSEGGLCNPQCFSRTFVMPCHRSVPSGDFTLDGLMHGRLDLVTRWCVDVHGVPSFGGNSFRICVRFVCMCVRVRGWNCDLTFGPPCLAASPLGLLSRLVVVAMYGIA
jgi:hypothetical protein